MRSEPIEEAHGSEELDSIWAIDRALFPESTLDGVLATPTADGAPRVTATGLPPALGPIAHSVEPTQNYAWVQGLSKPDIAVRWDSRVVRYLDYYKNHARGRSAVAMYLKKSGRYADAIRAVLRDHDMPEDIVWLALMESGFDPKIKSGAGAAGLWQFTEDSARAYGLRVDRWVDERLDPHRSTLAAVKYLKDLHKRFGRWELAFAAYNMGYGGLQSSIRKYNTNDYWELSRIEAGIPYETALYVPKIISMAIVARNCAAFGCGNLELEPSQKFDTVSVVAGTSLEAVAEAGDLAPEDVSELNPQLLTGSAPPGHATQGDTDFDVRVPAGSGSAVSEKLTRSVPDQRTLDRHQVRWGESIYDLADERGVASSRIRRDNALDAREAIRPGDVLMLPKRGSAKKASADERPTVVVAAQYMLYPGRERVFYRVAPGDELAEVAEVLGVTVDDLLRWNPLDVDAKLVSSMHLQAYVERDRRRADVKLWSEDAVDVLTVGTTAFFNHFEQKKGRVRFQLEAEPGDTWQKISKRYGISLGMLERINHRSRRSELSPGERVTIYCSASRAPKTALRDEGALDESGS